VGYDAGTGAEVKRIKLAHLSNAETLLGVIDDRMVLVSGGADGTDETTRAICINWRSYEMANFTTDPGRRCCGNTHRSAACAGAGSSPPTPFISRLRKSFFRST